jgi:glycosyl transferase, family 25
MDDVIPLILVISLADRSDRRVSCRSQLDLIPGLEWRFLDAIDGRGRASYPACYTPRWAEWRSGYRLSSSEVACFMSHRLAWWASVTENRPVVVLEDDFLLRPSFIPSIRRAIDARESWDVLRMQGLVETPSTPVAVVDGTTLARNLGDPCGSTACIVQPTSARALLATSQRMIEPVDTFLERPWRHGQRLLAVLPYPVAVIDSPSSITDRPVRYNERGWKRHLRSYFRMADRLRNLIAAPPAIDLEPPACW